MRSVLLLSLAVLLSLAAGCSGSSARPGSQSRSVPPATAAAPLLLADDAGRQVALDGPAQRIISLSASNTEILFALGLEARIVGVDDYSDFPASVKEKPRVGGFARPDLEKIVALEPDLVLATGIHVKAVLPELERRGLRTLVANPPDVKGVLARVRLVGKATGREVEAEALAADMAARIEAVEAWVRGARPVRVFYELSPELHSAGPGTFVDDLVRLAGGANIAAGAASQWPQLNQEVVFLADPEVIILGDHSAGERPEHVAARPGWRQISAVKNNRVVAINPDIANRPGPRVVEGLEFVARALHPGDGGQGSGR